MNPAVYIAKIGMKVPLRRIPVYDYKIATDYVLELEIVATQGVYESRISCDQAGWLHVSSDGGASYDPIPDSVQSGVNLGSLAAGDRGSIKIKVSIPIFTDVRRRFIGLFIGIGTGTVSEDGLGSVLPPPGVMFLVDGAGNYLTDGTDGLIGG